MSGLSEAELHVQAMRLVCEALQEREQDGLEVDWDVIRQMHDQMDAMLQDLWHKHRYDSSEMVDLRKDRDAARAEIETLRTQLENSQRELSEQGQAHSVELQQETANLRQQLDAARAAVTLQRSGIERLRRFVGGVEGALGAFQSISPDTCCDQIARCLGELEDSLAPVAEPLDAEGGA